MVFDPDNRGSAASLQDPCQFPTGIPHVIVNGVPVVDDHRRTGANARPRAQEPLNIHSLPLLGDVTDFP